MLQDLAKVKIDLAQLARNVGESLRESVVCRETTSILVRVRHGPRNNINRYTGVSWSTTPDSIIVLEPHGP